VKQTIAGAVVLLFIIGTFASCGGSGKSKSAATPATTEPSLTELIAQNPASEDACAYYFSLVNQGWNHDSIYDELDAAGAFNNYQFGTGKTTFDALVEWCYNH
jgi:hypothetical protein